MTASDRPRNPIPPESALLVAAHLFVLKQRNMAIRVHEHVHGSLPETWHRTSDPSFGRFHRYLDLSLRLIRKQDLSGVEWLSDFTTRTLPGLIHGRASTMMAWTAGDIVRDLRNDSNLASLDRLPSGLPLVSRSLLRAALMFIETEQHKARGGSDEVDSLLRLLDPAGETEALLDSEREAQVDRYLEWVEREMYDDIVVSLSSAADRVRLDEKELAGLVRGGAIENLGSPRKVKVRLSALRDAFGLPWLFPARSLVRPTGVLTTPLGEVAFRRGPPPTDLDRQQILGHVEVIPSLLGSIRLQIARKKLDESDIRAALRETNFDFWADAWVRAQFGLGDSLGRLTWEEVKYGGMMGGRERYVLYASVDDWR